MSAIAAPRIVVVDYGLGNLFNVEKGFAAVGADVLVSGEAADVESASALVLPGVGAFRDGMAGLAQRGLVAPIREAVARGKRLLGICLGMQLLMSESEEFGRSEGLALVPGRVVALQAASGFRAKVPHVGWNALRPTRPWAGSVLERIEPGEEAYFVHSFAVHPDDPAAVLAAADYGGVSFCAVLERGSVAGCQFHPEKSRTTGLRILASFVAAVASQEKVRA